MDKMDKDNNGFVKYELKIVLMEVAKTKVGKPFIRIGVETREGVYIKGTESRTDKVCFFDTESAKKHLKETMDVLGMECRNSAELEKNKHVAIGRWVQALVKTTEHSLHTIILQRYIDEKENGNETSLEDAGDIDFYA